MPTSLDDSGLFDDIPSVYSASKYEQKVTDAPAAVSIVTSDEIEEYGYRTLGEILASLPGVFETYDRNYNYLAVRGFGRPGDYNSRVLILVDGFRMNDAVYDSGAVGDDFPVDVDLIDRVELVRGPGSALYGSSAFLAVVNVVTKRGRDLQGLETSARYGSHDLVNGRVSYGSKFDSGFEFLVSGTYGQDHGDRSLYYPEFDDPATNFGMAVGADSGRRYSLLGEFAFREVRLQVGHGQSKKTIPTAPYDTYFNTDDNWTKDAFTWVDLTYDGQVGTGWRLHARAFYDHYHYQGDYVYDWSETDDPYLVVNRDHTWSDRWGSELSVSRLFFGRVLTTVGGTFDHSFRLDQKNEDVGADAFTYLDDKRDSFDWAVYSQSDIEIFENLSLNAGVRYDGTDTAGGSANPRVALIYHPFESTALKAIYGTAFRAPSAYELYYASLDTWKPNPDLDPETVQTVEFVVEQEIGEHFRAVGSAYYSEIDDLIELTVDPSDDFLVFDNRGSIDSVGGEFWVDGHWESGLTGRLSYAVQRSEERKTGRRITNSPRHMAKFNVAVPMNLVVPVIGERFLSGVTAGVELQYMSPRKLLDGSNSDDVFLTNLTVVGRDLIGGLTFSGGVNNLFNASYSDPGTLDHVQNEIPQNGRTLFIELTYRFQP
jgi:iron complex outermembrane receptor protein